jgi:hypothetical protein
MSRWGIEAKFTEPRYESVATWLGRAPTTNRADVLEGWVCAIEAATEASIQRDAVMDLPYQLIHRTASVCCVGRRKRLMVYQVFGDSPAHYYAEDLGRFAATLAAPERISFLVLGCAWRSTDTYARLEAGERGLGEDVLAAMLAGPLLEFGQPVAIPIG